jgi:hypothetical protein
MKPYQSFLHWQLTTQWPFSLLFHAIASYGIALLCIDPIEELGWAIAAWAIVFASIALFWLGNLWYYRKRLLPFMQRRPNLREHR